MKLAVIGGSFNPVHIGHLALADSVIHELGYDKVLFIPAFNPPHKIMQNAVSVQDRLSMVELACKKNKNFSIDSCELDRGGISYTYDTVCFLQEKYKKDITGKIGLILGQDTASKFHLWHKKKDLLNMVDLILAKRIDFSENFEIQNSNYFNEKLGKYTEKNELEDISQFQFPHKDLKDFILPVSSTMIRMNIAENKSWRYLVPYEVFHYIVTNKLYGYRNHNK